MNTIDPRFLTASLWAAQTTTELVPYGTIPVLLDDAAWRSWARSVTSLPVLSGLGAPSPENFATWQAWALAFNELARLLPA